jgi:hypothetical protein
VAHAPSHHGTGETHADGDHPAHVDAAEVPPPTDEPKTPLWLTALGGGLFAVVAIAWLASRPAGRTLSELTPPAETQAPAAAPAPTPAPAPAPAPAPMPAPAPPPAVIAPVNPANVVPPAGSAAVKKHKKKKGSDAHAEGAN